MNAEWESCEHEWEAEVDSQFSNEVFEAVTCVKCKCPGSRGLNNGEVYWPTT